MSLLMDALRRAEEAKRQAESAQAAPAPAALEIAPDAPSASPPAAEAPAAAQKASPATSRLSERLELLEDQYREAEQQTARARMASRPAAETEREREAAMNVFAAKQPESTGNRAFYIALGVATLVVAVAIGAYFWLQLQGQSGIGANIATAPRPAPLPPPQPAPRPAASVAPPPAAAAAPAKPGAAPPSRAAASAAPTAEPPTSREETVVPIRITRARVKANPALDGAFDTLQRGDFAAAREQYERVLRSEPHNTDALNGLAAIHLREGRVESAENYYTKAIEADPKNASAQAALIALRGSGDPVHSESRLKTLIASQPDAHPAHFALGNLYAREGRWAEAQQAYFNAHAGDPENPDYQFNLAVSLDQLRKPELAMQYYSRALAAADSRTAAFDKAQVAARLRELQQ